VLEPIERLAEGLFGVIMALTWTGSLSVAEAGREDVRTRLIGTLGCNLAWGIIDAIMDLPRTLRRYCAEGRNSREWSHGKPMYNQVITRMPVFSRGAAVHDAMAQADELYFLRQTVTRAADGIQASLSCHPWSPLRCSAKMSAIDAPRRAILHAEEPP
jgi:hypothetical protein